MEFLFAEMVIFQSSTVTLITLDFTKQSQYGNGKHPPWKCISHKISCFQLTNYHCHETIYLFWLTPPKKKSRLKHFEPLCFSNFPVLKRFLRLASVWIFAQQYFRSGDHKFEALGPTGDEVSGIGRRVPNPMITWFN